MDIRTGGRHVGNRGGRGGFGRGRGNTDIGQLQPLLPTPINRGRGSRTVTNTTLRELARLNKSQPTCFKKLTDLVKKEDCEVVFTLQDEYFGFKRLLKETEFSNEMVRLMLKVLTIVASCTTCPFSSFSLLNDVLSSQFLNFYVPQYLTMALRDEQEAAFAKMVIDDLLIIFGRLLTCFPTKAPKALAIPLVMIRDVASRLKRKGELLDAMLCQKLEDFVAEHNDHLFKFNAVTREDELLAKSAQVKAPPSDFRQMSIYPTEFDVHGVIYPFLRKNIVKGRYEDIDHYLDVNFRLLREDFVGPLRDSLTHYLTMLNQNKENQIQSKDVKIYYNVRVVFIEGSKDDGIVYHLSFDNSRLRNVQWEVSRRLTSGSLICMSANDFKTFKIGAIVQRDPKHLQDGSVAVRIIESQHNSRLSARLMYKMVESAGCLIEANAPLLRCLQFMTEESVPFKQYVIDAVTNIRSPRYLLDTSEYDFSVFMNNKKFESNTFCRPLVEATWPTAEQLNLDPSQYSALKTCLTKELAIVQGPPGTGKTFLGLKVVELLLANDDVWYDNRSPILVVCYTNHALDQFLERILRFCPRGVLRIGGMSKSKAMKDHNIKCKRRYGELPDYLYKTEIQLKLKLEQIRDEICREMEINMDSERIILPESELKQYMELIHFQSFALIDNEDMAMLDWLGLASETLQKEKQQQIVNHNMKQTFVMSEVEASSIVDIFKLDNIQRWKLYRYWVSKLREHSLRTVQHLQEQYDQNFSQLKKINSELDASTIQGVKVIGMTTSGAAKNRELLHFIQPKIVIVEEAAEVLEAHVITALTSSCQHLIMIGDQQQLRPSPAVYKLARDYHLDVSLFERLIRNELPYERLELQHRMRPRIAELLVPHIYKNLRNHSSVETYPQITGLASSVFFVNHNNLEYSAPGTESKVNEFEATFLVALCRHLLLQGYRPNQITILTFYLAQLFRIRELAKSTIVEDVLSTVVDNYQGEENDIILLSLVRCNVEGKVGFLKVDNRVCVALSRAKMGLYCIGNFDFLAEHSNIWKLIVASLKNDQLLDTKLILHCDNHPTFTVEAYSEQDFQNSPEGGCNRPCEFHFDCGHQCPKFCHVYDGAHLEEKCLKPCERLCPSGHNCKKLCFNECGDCVELVMKEHPKCGHLNEYMCHEDPIRKGCKHPCEKQCLHGHTCKNLCSDKCGDCVEPVMKEHPKCGHLNEYMCHEDPIRKGCLTRCNLLLPCSHRCQNRCLAKCTASFQCKEVIKKVLTCGHVVSVSCSDKKSDFGLLHSCKVACKKLLTCEHRCASNCSSCHQGRMHIRCQKNCGRVLICGHQCKWPCALSCPPCKENCENYCFHSRCRLPCGKPCRPCRKPCAWRCAHLKCTKRCHEICDRPPCQKPCRRKLRCGHPCIGFCGEPCPNLCRICDRDKVRKILSGSECDKDTRFVLLEDCGHVVEASAMDRFISLGTSAANADEHAVIAMKRCPRCNTIIRKTHRYNGFVKQFMKDVVSIKRRISKDYELLQEKLLQLTRRVEKFEKSYNSLFPSVVRFFQYKIKKRLHSNEINNMITVTGLFEKMVQQYTSPAFMRQESDKSQEIESASRKILEVISWILDLKPNCSEQQIYDFSREVQRVLILSTLVTKVSRNSLSGKAKDCFDEIYRYLNDRCPFTELLEEEVYRKLTELQEISTGLVISKIEKMEIIYALRLKEGLWYKCPNGHFYGITECGGATQKGRCNKCDAARSS